MKINFLSNLMLLFTANKKFFDQIIYDKINLDASVQFNKEQHKKTADLILNVAKRLTNGKHKHIT